MWLLYTLSAVIASTVLATLFKVASVRAKDSRTFAFTFNFLVLLICLIALLVVGVGDVNLDSYLVFLMLISTTGYGIFQRFQFTARKHLESSVTQTIMTPAGIVGYVLAILWLKEEPTILHTFGYLLIVVAAMIVSFRKGKFDLNKYAWLAFAISVALNVAVVIDRRVVPNFSEALTYVAILCVAQVLWCIPPKIQRKKLADELRDHKFQILLLAAVNFIAIFSTISALRLAPATYVTPILSSNVILISLAGIIFLKEREHMPAKLSAALLAFVGLTLLSI